MPSRKPSRPRTRTLMRSTNKRAIQNAPRPVGTVGGGQGGLLGGPSAGGAM